MFAPPADKTIRRMVQAAWLTAPLYVAAFGLYVILGGFSPLLVAALALLLATHVPLFPWVVGRMRLMRRAWDQARIQGLSDEMVVSEAWARRMGTDSTFSTYVLVSRNGVWLQPKKQGLEFVPLTELSVASEKEKEIEVSYSGQSIRLRPTGELSSSPAIRAAIESAALV
jgi:hypothetical protein